MPEKPTYTPHPGMSEVTTEPMDALTLRVAADAIVLLHLAFILWVGLGGLLIGRWPWLAGLHLPAVAWAVFIEVTGGVCPLTPWENALRQGSGEAGLPPISLRLNYTN